MREAQRRNLLSAVPANPGFLLATLPGITTNANRYLGQLPPSRTHAVMGSNGIHATMSEVRSRSSRQIGAKLSRMRCDDRPHARRQDLVGSAFSDHDFHNIHAGV
jgi:hypothetical protein